MNWALFASAVSAILAAAWLWLVTRRRWAWPGLVASIGCLIAASLNSAAPVRGLIDPDYVGYSFGLLQSAKGTGVTLTAGPVFLASAASALIGVSRRSGQALWLVAAVCAALLVILGVPTVRDAIADPSANAIQFGEYLTIPGLVGTGFLLLLLAVPFAVGLMWAPGAAGRRGG